jgi:hypothetical protein
MAEGLLRNLAGDRFEAHLSRQLYHALHELEAFQTKRFGGNAPRLYVQGLPKG